MRWVSRLLAVTAVALMASPAAAYAGGVAQLATDGSGTHVFVHEDEPTANVLAFGYDPVFDQFVLVDQTGMAAREPCFAVDANTVRCPTTSDGVPIERVIIAAQTRDDQVNACCTTPVTVSVVITGRGGDDVLEGSEGHNYLNGGPGDDLLRGDAGDDRLVGAGDADSLYGGAGFDLLDADDDFADVVIDCGADADRDPVYDLLQDPAPVNC